MLTEMPFEIKPQKKHDSKNVCVCVLKIVLATRVKEATLIF